MTAFLRLVFLASLVGPLGGCAEFQVQTQYHQKTDFASMRTYAWATSTVGPIGSLGIDRESLDARVHTAVDAALAEKGYRLGRVEDADFLLSYRAATKHKLESADLDNQRGYGAGLGRADDFGAAYGGGTGTVVEEYEEGTLAIGVLSRDGRHVLWSGSAQAAINQDASLEERGQRIARAAARILRDFPPD